MDTSPPTRFYALSFLVKTLRESLLGGRWSHTLPPERELASQLRVSRFTLRNALGILEEEGLVIIAQGKPTRISIPEAISPQPKPFQVNLIRLSSGEEPVDAETLRISQEIQVRLHVACIPCRELNASVEAVRRGLEVANTEQEYGGVQNLWILLNVTSALEELFSTGAPDTTLLVRSGSLECRLPCVDMHMEAIGRHLGTLANHRNLRTVSLLSHLATPNRAAHLLAGLRKTMMHGESRLVSWVADSDSMPDRLPPLLKKLVLERMSLLVLTSSELIAPVLFHVARGNHSIPGDFSLLCAAGSSDLRSFGIDLAFYEYQEAKIAKAVVQQIIDVIHIGGRGFRQHLLIPDYRPGQTMAEASRQEEQ